MQQELQGHGVGRVASVLSAVIGFDLVQQVGGGRAASGGDQAARPDGQVRGVQGLVAGQLGGDLELLDRTLVDPDLRQPTRQQEAGPRIDRPGADHIDGRRREAAARRVAAHGQFVGHRGGLGVGRVGGDRGLEVTQVRRVVAELKSQCRRRRGEPGAQGLGHRRGAQLAQPLLEQREPAVEGFDARQLGHHQLQADRVFVGPKLRVADQRRLPRGLVAELRRQLGPHRPELRLVGREVRGQGQQDFGTRLLIGPGSAGRGVARFVEGPHRLPGQHVREQLCRRPLRLAQRGASQHPRHGQHQHQPAQGPHAAQRSIPPRGVVA